MLQMHEIAVASSLTASLIELAALGFTEISHRWVLRIDLAPCVVAPIQGLVGFLGILFIVILDVDIPNYVLSYVITDIELFDFSVLDQFNEYLFKEVFKVTDCFFQDLLWNFLT